MARGVDDPSSERWLVRLGTAMRPLVRGSAGVSSLESLALGSGLPCLSAVRLGCAPVSNHVPLVGSQLVQVVMLRRAAEQHVRRGRCGANARGVVCCLWHALRARILA